MNQPKLSIVIPVRDQPISLGLTLAWFSKLSSVIHEVIVVDDGSQHSIQPLVDPFVDTLPIRVIHQENRGRSAARNAGWQAATGDRILFNDADRFPADSDLRDHLEGEGVVVGKIMEFYFSRIEEMVSDLRDNFSTLKNRARNVPYPNTVCTCLYDSEGKCRSGISWATFLTANVSLNRLDLEKVGGFDENFVNWGVEHFELGYRLWKKGVPFHYSEKAVNYHIAHRREAGFYLNNMQESVAYFSTKHPDPVVKIFSEFLFGKSSLQEVENQSAEPGRWLEYYKDPVMFLGLKSSLLASRPK